MDAVTVSHLDFGYNGNGKPIINNLDLNFPKGGITAVLGPNGCGKTTLLFLVVGLLIPDEGHILIAGNKRDTIEKKAIKQMVGLVPQNETVPFDLSLLEYVLLGRAPFLHLLQVPGKKDRQIARDAIEIVGLTHMIQRSVRNMSSGERQLAAIARSLAQEPDVLLLDEPTSHLDLANSNRVLKMMKTITGQGKTVVFTTHDPNAAAAFSDHVVLFGKNRQVREGGVSDILTSSRLTKAYGMDVEVMETHRGPVVLTI